MTSGNEFIELLALGTVDLSGWSLSGAVTMVLPTRFLLAGDTLVLAKDPAGILSESCVARDVIQRWFARVWSLRPSDPCDTGPSSPHLARWKWPEGNQSVLLQPYKKSLSSVGETVRLLDHVVSPPHLAGHPFRHGPGSRPSNHARTHARTHALGFVTKCSCFGACVRSLARRCVQGATHDVVAYGMSFPWPTIRLDEAARSIELTCPRADNAEGAYWRTSSHSSGATPGFANSELLSDLVCSALVRAHACGPSDRRQLHGRWVHPSS